MSIAFIPFKSIFANFQIKIKGREGIRLFLNVTTFDSITWKFVGSSFLELFHRSVLFAARSFGDTKWPNGSKEKGNRSRSSLLYNYGSFYGGDDDEVQHIKIALFSFIAFITVCSTVCYMK